MIGAYAGMSATTLELASAADDFAGTSNTLAAGTTRTETMSNTMKSPGLSASRTTTAAAATKATAAGPWQEFFDNAAKAKYWFNTLTGEATWVCPY